MTNFLERTKLYLYFLIIFVLSLGQFGRISIGEFFIGLYIWDILIGIFLFLFLLYSLNRKIIPSIPLYYVLGTIFISWAFLVTLNSYRYLDNLGEWIISSTYLVRWVVYFIFGFLVYLDMNKNRKVRNKIMLFTVISGILISTFGFMQLFFFADLSVLDPSLLWDPHKNRLVSTFLDPNFTGIAIMLCAAGVFYCALPVKWKILIITYFMFAIFFTYSRSAWLTVSIVVGILGIMKYRFIIPIFIILLFSTYYFIPRVQMRVAGITDPSDSFYFRIQSWERGINIAKDNLILGYGFNTYRYIQRNVGAFDYNLPLGNRSGSGVDSSLLLILINTGVVGVFLYLVSFWYLLNFSLKNWFRFKNKDKAGNYLLFFALIVSVLINSQFINSLLYPQIIIVFGLLTSFILSSRIS